MEVLSAGGGLNDGMALDGYTERAAAAAGQTE
jgi:hypothetical protein